MLLKQLLAGESRQIGRPLKVTADAIRALLLYDCPGNIDQLFNDIRLTCARAFLDATSKGTREVVITAAMRAENTAQHKKLERQLNVFAEEFGRQHIKIEMLKASAGW